MEKSIHNKSTFIIFIKPISSEGEKYIPREPGTCKIVGPVKNTGVLQQNQVLKKNHKKPFIISDERNAEGVSFEAASHGSNFLGQICPANWA